MALTKEEKIGLGILGAGAAGLIAWGIYEAVKKPPILEEYLRKIEAATTINELEAIRAEFEHLYTIGEITPEDYSVLFEAYELKYRELTVPPVLPEEEIRKFLKRIKAAMTREELEAIRDEFENLYLERKISEEQYGRLFAAYDARIREIEALALGTKLIVEVVPPELHPRIYLNGTYIGSAPVEYVVEPGEYTVSFEDERYLFHEAPVGVLYYIAPKPVKVRIELGETQRVVGEYTPIIGPRAVGITWSPAPPFTPGQDVTAIVSIENASPERMPCTVQLIFDWIVQARGEIMLEPWKTYDLSLDFVAPTDLKTYDVIVDITTDTIRVFRQKITEVIVQAPVPVRPEIELIDFRFVPEPPFAPEHPISCTAVIKNLATTKILYRVQVTFDTYPASTIDAKYLDPLETGTYEVGIKAPSEPGTYAATLYVFHDLEIIFHKTIETITVIGEVAKPPEARPAKETLPGQVAKPEDAAKAFAQGAALGLPSVEVAPGVEVWIPSPEEQEEILKVAKSLEDWFLTEGFYI